MKNQPQADDLETGLQRIVEDAQTHFDSERGERAFERLALILSRPAMRIARDKLTDLLGPDAVDPDDARDVASLSLFALYRRLPHFRAGSAVIPWFASLVRAQTKHFVRSKYYVRTLHADHSLHAMVAHAYWDAEQIWSGLEDPMRSSFLIRYDGFLERLAGSASPESMQTALAATDEVGGLAGVLASVGPIEPPPRDPLAGARARGAAMKSELLERAGGALSAGDVAELMEVTPAAVHARRQRGTLLAVRQANGEFIYPACQFGDDGPLAGLGQVLAAFRVEGAWTRLSVLLSPAPSLRDESPLDALRRGDVAGAVDAIATYGEQGA
jgi:DNA-directed RNA polymerase specialized sigma24 family protein